MTELRNIDANAKDFKKTCAERIVDLSHQMD
jgi:hypothetical protein